MYIFSVSATVDEDQGREVQYAGESVELAFDIAEQLKNNSSKDSQVEIWKNGALIREVKVF